MILCCTLYMRWELYWNSTGCNVLFLQALFFESILGVNLKVLELMDAKPSPWAIDRLSRSVQPPLHCS